MHDSNPPWYILGTGAIGTLFAAKFLQQSLSCILLDRASIKTSPSTAQLTKTLHIIHFNETQESFDVATSPIDSQQKINRLLLCTKSYQSLTALQSIAHRFSDNAIVVLLQNGMGQQQLIQRAFPKLLIIAATTSQGALLTQSLKVKHTGNGPSVFGCFNPSATIPKNITQALLQIGMHWVPDIQQRLWNKLKINAVINPLTALNNCHNGQLLSNAQLYKKVQLLCLEIDALDIKFNSTSHVSTLGQVVQVATATASNRSSMLQDISLKRKTEIEFINQYLQNKADEFKLDTPINQQLISDIQALENRYR